MKKIFLLSIVSFTFLFANNYEEMSLDKLKNKKVYSMSIEEFENIKAQEEKRKESLLVKKESIPTAIEEVVVNPVSNEPIASNKSVVNFSKANVVEDSTSSLPSILKEIKALNFDSSISYFLEKYKDLTVYEFEEAKSILYEKIKNDSRFDQEMISSINILALNKIQFIDFLSEVKNSIINR